MNEPLPERTAVPGEPLPPLPESAYPPGAVPLDELPELDPELRPAQVVQVVVAEGLVIRPGDTLVVSVGPDITDADFNDMLQAFRDHLPDVRVVLVTSARIAVRRGPQIDDPARPLVGCDIIEPHDAHEGCDGSPGWKDPATGLTSGGLVADDPATGEPMTPERHRKLYGVEPPAEWAGTPHIPPGEGFRHGRPVF